MLTRETIKLTKLTLLPSGRGMAALCRDVWTVKYMRHLAHLIDRRKFLQCGNHLLPPKMIIGSFLTTSWQIPVALRIWTSTNIEICPRLRFSRRVGNCPSQSRTYTLHFSWSSTHWTNLSHINRVVRIWGGNHACGIYRSPSGMAANTAESPSATTRPGTMKNERETFRRYSQQKPFWSGVDKVGTAKRKINDMVT